MSLTIDPRVRTAGSEPMSQSMVLPAVPGAADHRDVLPDRVGHSVREHGLTMLAAGGAVGIGTALLRGNGVLAKVGWGVGSLVLGTGVALAAAVGLDAVGEARARTAAAARADDPARAPKDAPGATPHEQLRVMTLNMHDGNGPGADTRTRAQRWQAIAELVQREHPDVLLLQEVSDFSPVAGWNDMVQELDDNLHPTGLAFSGGDRAIGTVKGTAVLTFGGAHIEDARDLRLEDVNGEGTMRRLKSLIGIYHEWRTDGVKVPADESVYHSRNATDALVVTAGGRAVRVASAHQSGGVDAPNGIAGSQDRQLVPLANALATTASTSGDAQLPTILAGDFNVRSNSDSGAREARVLGAAGLHDAFTSAGIAVNDPRRISFGSSTRIDRIYGSSRVGVTDVTVVGAGTTDGMVSDHRPVVADLTIN